MFSPGNILIWVTLALNIVFSLAGSIDQESYRDKRQSYGITTADIYKIMKRLENKLTRHEYREAQLADYSRKSLSSLTTGYSDMKKVIKTISQQLAKMEERTFALESLITTTDERQRHILQGLSDGVNLLISRSNLQELPLPQLGPYPGSSDMSDVVKTIKDLDSTVRNDIRLVDNEVKIVGELLQRHTEQLRQRHDQLWTSVNTCSQERAGKLSEIAQNLTQTDLKLQKHVKEVLSGKGGSPSDCSSLAQTVTRSFEKLFNGQQENRAMVANMESSAMQALEGQKRDITTLIHEEREERTKVQDAVESIVTNLQGLHETSATELGRLENTVREIITENSDKITNGVNSLASTLKMKTTNIIDALDDSMSQRENLEDKIKDSFTDLTDEIKGLKKVEQVMISTADAVLDTKRSIEFGIRQVIIELSDIVRNSGSTINSTLSDKINDISFAILKNQTSALTNMTAKMEQEISQVWRQIGVMYQQVAQSVNILDDLQSTTSQQMNASLNQVNHMDGTVGKINSKVAGVEDDLNYLLGRLSLVVSEFKQMKSGVGHELEKLRNMAQEFSGGEIVEYKVQGEPDPQ